VVALVALPEVAGAVESALDATRETPSSPVTLSSATGAIVATAVDVVPVVAF
jgi:hypothetical protein